ncbi:MAG: hypothetical protein PHU85_07230 [Phycisphaerae bacterium]|nr:hypothetical protein [Phycisphaerae bacterium]
MTASYQTCNYSASADLTIALASLASSATHGAGAYATFVDNTTTGYSVIHVYAKITGGTNALAGTIDCYALKSNGVLYPDGITQPTGGAWTITPTSATPASPLAANAVMPTNTTNGEFTLTFSIYDPGPSWSVGVMHDTGVNLNATAGNFALSWVGERGKTE